MSDEGVMLTRAQLAKREGVHKNTIINWEEQGIGPKKFQMLGTIRYRLSDVIEWERIPRRAAKRSRKKTIPQQGRPCQACGLVTIGGSDASGEYLCLPCTSWAIQLRIDA